MFALINDWGNIIAFWEESKKREALANKLDLFQMQLGVWGTAQTQENFAFFTLI